MSERLADGLTDADSIMAKSVVDPLLKLPYEEFKQSMLSFLESKNGHAQLTVTTGQRQPQPQPQSGHGVRLSANQKTINAKVHSAVAVELGLDSNACIRCGLKGHHASTCTTGSIHRQHERRQVISLACVAEVYRTASSSVDQGRLVAVLTRRAQRHLRATT
ncbi:hypothetical protein FOL46_004687, partial [Perkinsus olseni]